VTISKAFHQQNRGNSGIRSQKVTNLIELYVRKPLVLYIPQRSEEPGLYNLVQRFDNFKPRLKNRFLQLHFLAEWFIVFKVMIQILGEKVKTYRKTL
jgi:hypothetical protein